MTNKEAKVNNWYLIEDALRHLKVRFDGKLTHNIMQEERGAALRLLYQLKLAIQKREGPPPDALEQQTMTGLKMSTVQRKMQQNFEKTNSLAGTIQPRTVGGKDIRTNKQKMQDAHLIKFEVAKKNLFDDAIAQHEQERNLINKIEQQKRADNRRKLRENQEFMKEWEEEGFQNWAANRKKRFDNIARQKYFEDREVNLYKEKLNKELNEATYEMRNGQSEFEKNLQKLGIDNNLNMEDAMKRQEEKQGIPPGQIQNFSFPATMNKIKETKKQSDFAGKERERRRRKLAVDQAKTQERLDKQKQEDMLIQKLMKQQQEEQDNAYADERLRKCKGMLAEQRSEKAEQVLQKRQVKQREMQAQEKLEAKSREAARKIDIERQQEEYKQIARGTKMIKRSLNIEIASGVVDLVLDLADEVFDVSSKQPGKKLTKAQWREFSQMFIDGKKVSLRNIKKQIVDADKDQKAEEDGVLTVPSNIPAHEILDHYNKQPALHDLFQFISNSGLFNLDQLKPELIKHWCNVLKLDKFVSNGGAQLVDNKDLGKLICNLYMHVQAATSARSPLPSSAHMNIKDKFIAEEIKEVAEEGDETGQIPSQLPLKLAILGRAFSGKKTIARQLQEKYGGEKNVKLFSMDDIVKEALDYIVPKKVDEAALEAAKKAKKGKVEEVVSVDIFEGKHVQTYKKLATEMKNQFFRDYEGDNLPQQADISNLVFDDHLLVSLFVERLKLEYEGVDLSVSISDIEAGIKREKELVEQLAELEETQVSADPKKGGKAPAKGQKTNDETLREELESIRNVTPKGWILIDFPRSLTQMKLLETCLSGFESQSDQPKSLGERKFETWSQIATPPCLVDEEAVGAFEAQPSGLDGVVILETTHDECKRRAKGRKIDPQTQVVYHMATNAPEDAKVLERLQDYHDAAGDPDRMDKRESSYNQSIGSIKQWLTSFGLKAEDGTCQVQLDMPINMETQVKAAIAAEGESDKEPSDPWKNSGKVFEAVLDKVSKIIEFRQREYTQMREKLCKEMEERERVKLEEAAAADNSSAGGQGSQSNIERVASAEPADEKATSDQKRPTIEVENQDGENEALKTISSSKKLLSDHQNSVGGTSKSIGRSTKFMQRIQELSDRQKVIKWEEMQSDYFSEGMQAFFAMRSLRQRVCHSLNETQRKFIGYLGRRSDQQRKVNDYCENYNRFSREFPDLIGNSETKAELLNRVDMLSKQLWENIKARKDESMTERLSYMEGGWVQIEMTKLCSCIARLIGNEFKRIITISAVVTGHLVNEQIDLEDFAKRLAERGVEPYIDNQEDRMLVGESPLLLEVSSTILQKVEALYNEQFVLSLDQKILKVLNAERENFSMRLNLLFTWATLILHEISNQAFQVFDVLDDWVVIAVKRENQASQQAVKEISQAVQEGAMHIEPVILQSLDLERHIETIEFYEGPPQYMNESKPRYSIDQARFSVDSLRLLYRQFRTNQEDTKLIDAQSFQSLMLRNLQAGVLPNAWRFIPFDAVIELAAHLDAKPLSDNLNSGQVQLFRQRSSAQIDSSRKFVDWRKAFTIFILIAGRLPTREDLQSYINKVRAQQKVSDNGLLTKDDFIKVPAWYDKYESAPMSQPSSAGIGASTLSDQRSPRTSAEPGSMSSVREMLQQEASADEDEDEIADEERLEDIKAMLFDTYRIQNQCGLNLNDFVCDLEFIFRSTNKGVGDERSLYHSMLKMQE